MALSKAVETPSGVEATYWRIVVTRINHELATAEVSYAGWVDEAAYDAAFSPLEEKNQSFSVSEYARLAAEDVATVAWDVLLATGDLTGATVI